MAEAKVLAPMKARLAYLLFLPIVVSCSTMEMVKRPENKMTLIFQKDYQTVYRIIVQNSEACSSPQQFKTNIFPDNKTASITEVTENITGYTIDIKATGHERTQVDLFFGFEVQRKFLSQRISSWVNDGETKCKYNGYPIFGPE